MVSFAFRKWARVDLNFNFFFLRIGNDNLIYFLVTADTTVFDGKAISKNTIRLYNIPDALKKNKCPKKTCRQINSVYKCIKLESKWNN